MSNNVNKPPPSPHYASSTNNKRHYNEKDYEEIYYHFDDYAADILLSNTSQLLNQNDNPEHYQYEDVILDEASELEWIGLQRCCAFGCVCGLLSFGLLRMRWGGGSGGGGGLFSKYASRSSGGYKFDPVHPSGRAGNLSSYQQTPQQFSGNTRSGFLFNTVISTFIGTGSSLLALQTDVFYPKTATTNDGGSNATNSDMITPPPQWISPQVPLVPRRSIVSDLLCEPLTAEFRKFPKDLWQSANHRGIENNYNNHIALYANGGWKDTKWYNQNPNASVVSLGETTTSVNDTINIEGRMGKSNGIYEQLVVDSLQGFVINCERRSRYEKKLRKLRGMKEGASVMIPEDGVTADEDLELDDIYLIENDEDTNDNGENDFGL
mmetsp:Transcript_5447/g.12071  ORF Transcript_5447/g.12071 Transcript_5447/m.12071 type:complete len:379 (+) Transcript_5447:151-1287(+)